MPKISARFLIIKKLNKKTIVFFFILFILFFLKGYYFLDPDFGWHLKMGELILQKGIPATDPFSYTMPSYPFVDHEWFFNIIIFRLFSFLGLFGLSMLFALLTITAIVISTRSMRISISSTVAFFTGIVLISFTGIRVQVVSWIYCSLLMFFLLKRKKNKWLIWSIPLGVVIWSNTHGSFPIGILILLIYYISGLIKTGRIQIDDFVIFFLSVAVTFLPPYGWRRWWEVWMQMSDGGLRWSIQEWTPLFFLDMNIALIGYLAFSIALFIKYHRKLDLFLKSIYIVFLFMAVSSIRHVPLWLCISCFQLGYCFNFLFKDVADKQLQSKISKFVLYYALVLCSIQLAIICATLPSDIKKSLYPEKAIEYLIHKNMRGNIFNAYGWGGLLIWKYPEKKVFIDGRMPSWRWKAPSKNESGNAFDEWRDIFLGKADIESLHEKYNIEVVLIPTSQKMFMCKRPSRLNSLFKTYNNNQEKDVFKNQKIIYQDKIATIYSVL